MRAQLPKTRKPFVILISLLALSSLLASLACVHEQNESSRPWYRHLEGRESRSTATFRPCLVPTSFDASAHATIWAPGDTVRRELFSAIGLVEESFSVLNVSTIGCPGGSSVSHTEPGLFDPFRNGIDWYKELSSIPSPFMLSRYRITLMYGLVTHLISLKPVGNPDCAIIFHGGHGGVADGIDGILDLLMSGVCWVVFAEMPAQSTPPYYEQSSSVAVVDGLELDLSSPDNSLHDNFRRLEEASNESALGIFLAPALLAVDLVSRAIPSASILMTGLSGGGWATHVVSALDTRIDFSVAVAGSVPGRGGDFEQSHPSLIAMGYPKIYALASSPAGRRSFHVLAFDDPCCFSQAQPEMWVEEVQGYLEEMGGGSYQVVLVYNFGKHAFGEVSAGLVRDFKASATQK